LLMYTGKDPIGAISVRHVDEKTHGK